MWTHPIGTSSFWTVVSSLPPFKQCGERKVSDVRRCSVNKFLMEAFRCRFGVLCTHLKCLYGSFCLRAGLQRGPRTAALTGTAQARFRLSDIENAGFAVTGHILKKMLLPNTC